MTRRPTLAIALCAVAGLALMAACGGDDDDAPPSATSTSDQASGDRTTEPVVHLAQGCRVTTAERLGERLIGPCGPQRAHRGRHRGATPEGTGIVSPPIGPSTTAPAAVDAACGQYPSTHPDTRGAGE